MLDKENKFIDVDFEKSNPEDVDKLCHYGGWTYREIFERNDYQRRECVLEPGDIVVDIGANIGFFTVLAGLKGVSKIYSFEPNTNNFACLVENAPKNCRPFNMGIMKEPGFYDLHIDKIPGGHSFFDYETETRTGELKKVFCLSLKSFWEIENLDKIDFLKIDTEGAEKEILETLTAEDFRKIRKLAFEYHHFINGNAWINSFLQKIKSIYNFEGVTNGDLSVICCWQKND